MRAIPSSIPCHLRDVGESSAEPGCSIQAILLCGAILRRGRKSLKRHIDWQHIFITLELPQLLPVPHTVCLQKPIESKSKKYSRNVFQNHSNNRQLWRASTQVNSPVLGFGLRNGPEPLPPTSSWCHISQSPSVALPSGFDMYG